MNFKNESLRKLIHISSLIIPFTYRYVLQDKRRLGFCILFAAFVVAMIVEFYRLWQPSFRRFFHRLFGLIMRRHELRDFTGATYLLFSSMLCIAFFEPVIAFSALSFLAIGDTFAAVVGINLGKRKILGLSKTLEGSLACFISCLVFGLFFMDRPWIAFWGALSATLAELWVIRIDDNIKIPIVSGICMSLAAIFI